MLADYNAEEIHYRLDRLYLETILSGSSKTSQSTFENENIAALQEELDSLYPEIEILAEMSTKQQFHEPILREIHNQHSQLRAASEEKLERVCSPLYKSGLAYHINLNNPPGPRRTHRHDHFQRNHNQTTQRARILLRATQQLATLYQTEVGNPLATQPPSRRESLRRRSMQPGLLLTAPRTNTTSQPEQPALESLLRRSGVSPESVIRPRAEDGGAQCLHEKRIQLSETLRALGMAVDKPLVSQLVPADKALHLLSSALHANSRYEVSLRDMELEEALAGLESELGELQKGVQGLDMDVLHQRDKTRDRFLERWG